MTDKIITILLVVSGFILQLTLVNGIKLGANVLSDLITFYSIVFGFYITSISIFVTSRYMKKLHKIEDLESPGQSLLNTLLDNYKVAILYVLATIVYLILLQFIIGQKSGNNASMLLSDKYTTLFIPIMFFNLHNFYKLLRDLIKVILREAET